MRQHPRTPAISILLIGLAIGISFLCLPSMRTSAVAKANQSLTLEQLEIAIARTNADTRTWLQYAEQLQQRKRFALAALAYEKVLEREPYDREARFHCASALALAGNDEPFFGFMRDLVFNDAKLAVELFARPECKGYLSQPRFQSLQQEARSQSMD